MQPIGARGRWQRPWEPASQGQDCPHISGLLVRNIYSSGLDEPRAYRLNQAIGFEQPLGFTGFQCADLTCCVIIEHPMLSVEFTTVAGVQDH